VNPLAAEKRERTDTSRNEPREEGFGAVVARKAVEPIAAAAVTAGAAYLTRKSSHLWRQKVAPKIREQGGPRAAAENTIKQASEKVGERGSATISTLTERGSSAFSALTRRVGDLRNRSGRVPISALSAKPNDRREKDRTERERRRNERRRALKRSAAS
jgi:hypothetical protein